MRRTGVAVLVLLAVVAGVLPASAAMGTTGAPGPVVISHRGGAADAPENTLGAFRSTHARWGDRGVWLELDTQLAADGVAVVIHDDSVDRTTDCTGEVASLTSGQLAECNAAEAFPGWGAFEPVPKLVDVLGEAKAGRWRLMVELKSIPGESNFDPGGTKAADALLAALQETGFPAEHLIVQSFWPPALDRIEQRGPQDLRTALLTTSQLPGAPPGAGFHTSHNLAYSAARGYEVVAPDQHAPDLNADAVALAHALGKDVVPWTADRPAEISRLAAVGVDGIITNDVDVAYATLR